jgi:hypothetical protein
MWALASTLTPPTEATNSRSGGLLWWPDEAQGQHLEVLHNRGEVELISGAGQATQTHARKR